MFAQSPHFLIVLSPCSYLAVYRFKNWGEYLSLIPWVRGKQVLPTVTILINNTLL